MLNAAEHKYYSEFNGEITSRTFPRDKSGFKFLSREIYFRKSVISPDNKCPICRFCEKQ